MLRPAAALATLLAIFGAAFAVGRAIGDGGKDEPARDGGMAGMAGDHAAADAAHGLGVAENGLRLLAPSTLRAGAAAPFRFRVVDDAGATVRAFDVEHTKRLHFIAVRRDLTGFQHLHPEQDAAGAWRTNLTLREPGAYRVFADFTPSGGEATTLASDVLVGGAFAPRALPAPATRVRVDGYDVALRAGGGRDATLRFSVSRDGRPVAVQPYLGAAAHLVALRAGDLAYLHVHPLEGKGIAFAATYPSAGRYRLFLQFRHGGRVHTAAFTQAVSS
ncbi:MAG TPA: hypothetical protein VNT55_20265 [Baekduia sp.]|nr:hypothetical protein [Baekduia sp.]